MFESKEAEAAFELGRASALSELRTAAQVAEECDFSRQYVYRFLREVEAAGVYAPIRVGTVTLLDSEFVKLIRGENTDEQRF